MGIIILLCRDIFLMIPFFPPKVNAGGENRAHPGDRRVGLLSFLDRRGGSE